MNGDDEQRAYEAGRKLGEAIMACFEAIARLEGISYREAVDQWVGAYISQRVREQARDST